MSCLVGDSRRHIFSWRGSNEVHLSSCNTESFTCISHYVYDLQIPRLTNNYTRVSKSLEISSWNVNGLFKTINNQKFSKLSSKAVIPMLFLILCCGLYHGALGFFLILSCSLFSFLRLFSILITSLGEDGVGLCTSHTFVCLFVLRVYVFVLFLFLLVSSVGCGL